MTWAEQDRADHTGRWAVAPDHEPRGGRSGRMIGETDRYAIVEVDEIDDAER